MSAIDEQFKRLSSEGRKAFMPFITAGDPNISFTAHMISEFEKHGCSLCELGVPYSDPIADGPVIQASYTRALNKKTKVSHIMEMGAQTLGDVKMPVVLMVSYAIIWRHGIEQFIKHAVESGFAGAIVPDLPVEESRKMSEYCRAADFNLIQLVTPTTPRERAVQIADSSSGFLYYVSVAGITGERKELPAELHDDMAWIRERTELPICVGFGISRPEHIKLLSPVADGFIVGSAIVRILGQAEEKGEDVVAAEAIELVDQLVAAAG